MLTRFIFLVLILKMIFSHASFVEITLAVFRPALTKCNR